MSDNEYLQRQVDHLEDEITLLRNDIRDILFEINMIKEEMEHKE